MLDLSLYVLDIVQNSVTAGAERIDVGLCRNGEKLIFTVRDDGCGMPPDFLAKVLDPFTTTRKTRSVGLGLPFLKQLAEQTGGSLTISSTVGVGTELTAAFFPEHIDMVPLGDIGGTVITLIQGSPGIRFVFTRRNGGKEYTLDTDELKEALGGVALNEPEVLAWITEFLSENEAEIAN